MSNENDQQPNQREASGGEQTAAAPSVAGLPGLTPEQLDELKQHAAKADEYWEHMVRQAADFENYKKRAARERQDAIKFANESLLLKLIPILDNFEMALAAAGSAVSAEKESETAQSLQTGVGMIYNQLKNTLLEAGMEEVDAANRPFDPNFHEAVSQQETDEVPDGHVVRQLRKGYKLRERLIRPATVVVAKSPAPVS